MNEGMGTDLVEHGGFGIRATCHASGTGYAPLVFVRKSREGAREKQLTLGCPTGPYGTKEEARAAAVLYAKAAVDGSIPGIDLMKITIDDLKHEALRAFEPLRCEFRDHDYDAEFEMWAFDKKGNEAFHAKELRVNAYQDTASVKALFDAARASIAAKGHDLMRWSPSV
jgi:hypothetical protein